MEKLSNITPRDVGTIYFSHLETGIHSPLFEFKVNKSFTRLNTTEEIVRIYRGIEYGDPYDQVASMARTTNPNPDPDAPFSFNIVYQTSQEILPTVLELAENPTPENYLKYCKLCEELELIHFPLSVDLIGRREHSEIDSFIDRLVSGHRTSPGRIMGISPYLAAGQDLSKAIEYGSTIIVADIPKKELVYSQFAEEKEVLIKGQLKPEYIRGIIENIYNPTQFRPSKDTLNKIQSVLAEFLM